jgi:hypothetical protein
MRKKGWTVAKHRPKPLVRYVSPFGSPAWMTREQAQVHLAEDDARLLWLEKAEAEGAGPMLTPRQRQIGPPRIEYVH